MRLLGDLSGKKVVVVGLGASGKAAARALAGLSASVTVVDHAKSDSLLEIARLLDSLGIKCHLGGIPADVMRGAEMIVMSPGVPTDLPEVVAVRGSSVSVIGEMELSYLLCDCEFLAVTGTKGKSTTTRLLYAMLSEAKEEVIIGGNLPGMPLCDRVLDLSPDAKVVAEVSSFQLETIEHFKPHIACITNLDVDHLDRYDDLSEYHEAKLRIFENQTEEDFLVINGDDRRLRELARGARSKQMIFSANRVSNLDGAFLESGIIVLRRNGEVKPLISRVDVRIPGLHNIENVMAAGVMAAAAGVSCSAIGKALRNFRLAPHTLEVFTEIDGITFVDDSHATNSLSVRRALEAFHKPIIIIMGGKDKGCDFRELLPVAKKRVKAVIAMGEAGPRVRTELGDDLLVVLNKGEITDVVAEAKSLAEAGDVILLSPGCSSFDMFADFRDRGKSFKRAVFNIFSGEDGRHDKSQ